MQTFEGNIVDVVNKKIFQGRLNVENGKIVNVEKCKVNSSRYILPGLVDSHIHIESSMVSPQRFAEVALSRGVVSVVADPHEITNVCGENGFKFMLKDASKSPMKIYFGVPSCVPATSFETSGAVLDSQLVAKLMQNKDVVCLSEMMNFPGVLENDAEVMAKIQSALSVGKPVDGHAPNIDEASVEKYSSAGISTDHECSTLDEARVKIKHGIKIQMREGSAAKNMLALAPLYREFPDMLMLCSDDFHPDDLQKGYIFERIKLLVNKGYDFFDVLRSATLNPIEHYKLNVGLLRVGDAADFVVTENIKDFPISQVVVDGNVVFENDKILFSVNDCKPINKFNCRKIAKEDIRVSSNKSKVKVIKVIDKELLTECFTENIQMKNGCLVSDTKKDVLKVVCLNRYNLGAKPSVGFINGFGLKLGAIASCISHDSHNIICVGADDDSIVKCVNKIVENRGGLAVSSGSNVFDMKLEIGGIMTNSSVDVAAQKYSSLSTIARALGCKLTAPFMTLAFMTLPVIPHLKITDKGVFDVDKFEFTNVIAK